MRERNNARDSEQKAADEAIRAEAAADEAMWQSYATRFGAAQQAMAYDD